MKPQKNYVGGRKEAQLARVGRESHSSDQEKVYVPTDAEYTYYQELFQGYFKQLTRWQDIFKQFEENISPDPENGEHYASNFLIIQTPDGRVIRPDPRNSYETEHNPDLLLRGWNDRGNNPNNPSNHHGTNHIRSGIHFYPEIAGKQLFIDADNTTIA